MSAGKGKRSGYVPIWHARFICSDHISKALNIAKINLLSRQNQRTQPKGVIMLDKEKMHCVSKTNPCPICGMIDGCLVAENGNTAICKRIESAIHTGDAGYLHTLTDLKSAQPKSLTNEVDACVSDEMLLLAKQSQQTMTTDEICTALQIKRSTFYSMKQNGNFGLMPLRFCRHLRYKKNEFELWLSLGTPNRQRFQNILKGRNL